VMKPIFQLELHVCYVGDLIDCKVYYQNSFKDLTKTKEVLFCLAVTEVGHPGQGRSYFEVGKPALSHEESGLKVRCNLLLKH